MKKESVLIRLLKDGHISNDEFKLFCPKEEVFIPFNHTEYPLNPDPLEQYHFPFINSVKSDLLPGYQITTTDGD